MLAVPVDRLPAALADLDPGNRALLDLSLRRGVSDAEIGELLRKDPGDVARGREAVLELLADALRVDGPDRRERVRRAIVELPDEAWRARASHEPPPEPPAERPRDAGPPALREPAPVPAPARPEDREPEREEPPDEKPEAAREEPEPRPAPLRDRVPFEQSDIPPRRTGRLLALVGALVVAVVLAIVLIGGGDDEDDDSNGGGPADTEPAPPSNGERGRVALRPLNGGDGSARFSLRGARRAVLSVRGLPRPKGSYQAWLYNDVAEAVPLGTFRGRAGRITLRLPADARRYRFVDISQEPADDNPNHSGDSVLRARVSRLLRR